MLQITTVNTIVNTKVSSSTVYSMYTTVFSTVFCYTFRHMVAIVYLSTTFLQVKVKINKKSTKKLNTKFPNDS